MQDQLLSPVTQTYTKPEFLDLQLYITNYSSLESRKLKKIAVFISGAAEKPYELFHRTFINYTLLMYFEVFSQT